MWKAAIKLAILYMLRNRFSEAKTRLKGDLNKIKDSFADLAEGRAVIFKKNLNNELHRIVNSLMGYMLIVVAIMCSSITAIIWLAATALNSPYRNLIFSITILLPLFTGLIIFLMIRHSWKKEPLFHQSIDQIKQDWQLFREAGDLDTDTSLIKSTDLTAQ